MSYSEQWPGRSSRGLPGPEHAADALHEQTRHRTRRLANVYDAVAGRVTSKQPLRHQHPDQHEEGRYAGDKESELARSGNQAPVLAPEEVLFRRRTAPERYAEHDIYMAHERDLSLSGRDVLPDSDLLKAMHVYASHYYNAMATRGPGSQAQHVGSRGIDEGSMDETALLAFGILLEEAGRQALGRRGDLVFTEGQEESLQAPPAATSDRAREADMDGQLPSTSSVGHQTGSHPSQPLSTDATVTRLTAPVTVGFQSSGSRRQRKRRKLADTEDED